MLVLDASSIVKAWDDYPPKVFPKLWDWLADEVQSGNLRLTERNLDEVSYVSPDCHSWLKSCAHKKIPVSESILAEAVRIKSLLGIAGESYAGRGVDEADLIAIAAAKVLGCPLVSDEQRQPALPKLKKNYKIPAACDLPTVGVPCISILEHITAAGKQFG